MERKDGPWKIHPYREPAEVPEKKPLPDPFPKRGLCDDLIEACVEFYEDKMECPDFIELAPDLFHQVLTEMYNHMSYNAIPPSNPGMANYQVYVIMTPVGKVELRLNTDLELGRFSLIRDLGNSQ